MKFTTLVAAAMAVSLPAMAQDAGLISSVTEDSLAAFAEAQGHEVLGYGEAGEVSVRAESADGIVYYLTGTACTDGTCTGINMSARFDANEQVTLETINDANIRRAAVSVWLLDNTLGISRYVILDGGMTEENIQINFDNFIAIVPAVIDMFYEE
ncbi:YbjN domain-containing protein [Henriciella sp. AS95]|uniref:YbjN domain-containing protein n=1 Tax=Henriciella sp. AS95 TaxID=3135782 RepID=UPI0031770AE7